MPRSSVTLQPPDHPIALRPTHLLASMPDLLTDTATTLIITRENTLFGPDFLVHQLRWHKSLHSRQRQSLLFTVTSRFWRKSQHREIRDASSGRPLLELRRQGRQQIWRVKQAGGGGDELLSANMSCAIGMKMLMRVTNALLAASQLDESHQQQLQQHAQFQASRRAVASQRPANCGSPPQGSPPPYSAVIADHTSDYFARSNNSNTRDLAMDENGLLYLNDDDNASTLPPSYDSIRHCTSHSLQDLLDAVEPPREPAPSSSFVFSPARRYSEAAVNEQEELEVLQLSNAVTTVMMGDRTIIGIRLGKIMNYHLLLGTLPRWEVQIAEGVDLLLPVCIVLILAEFAT